MALTAEGAQLTQQHRQAQLALRAATIQDLTRLWPMFDGSSTSFKAFAEAAAVLAQARYVDSAGLASAYYRAFRAAEGAAGEVTPRRPGRLASELIQVALMATGLVGTRRALAAGKTEEQARASGLVQASGALSRLVLNGGRQTIEDTIQADPEALGWVRITSGSPCAFCAMLASRGPVYKTRRTGRFQAHDHCSCAVEPFYRGSTLPAFNKEMDALWADVARGKDDQLKRFRRAYEGRGGQPGARPTPTPEPEPTPAPVVPEPRQPEPEPVPEPARGEEALAAAPLGIRRPDAATALTAEERASLREYKGQAYSNLNTQLRRTKGDLPDSFAYEVYREYTRDLDGVMERSRLTRDVAVHRAIRDGSVVFGEAWNSSLVGAEWIEYAYMSTTADPKVVKWFWEKRAPQPCEFRIRVPRGVGAVELSTGEYESELLLERGLRLRVLADSGPTISPRILEMEIIR